MLAATLAFLYLTSLFAAYQTTARFVERKAARKVESLKLRLETAQSEMCNLAGENGALKHKLARAESDALRVIRRAREATEKVIPSPRADEVFILGGEDLRPEFEPTQRMCHV